MADGGIQINGGFAKAMTSIIAGVIVILLGAGVIGVWDMNAKVSRIGEKVEWLVKQVDDNTDRLNRIYDGGGR